MWHLLGHRKCKWVWVVDNVVVVIIIVVVVVAVVHKGVVAYTSASSVCHE